VELDPGSGTFEPLIDGPIVGRLQTMSAQPGQSIETLIVQDDSVLLNREEKTRRFEDRAANEIAREIFGQGSHLQVGDVDSTKTPTDGSAKTFQRETDIQHLRRLALHFGLHAYVLPGREPGRSLGYFRAFDTKPDGLPPLILVGEDRNVETFQPREDAQSPATVKAQTLSLVDKSVTKASASFGDIRLLGSEAAGSNLKVGATRILPPGADGAIDADTAVRAAAERFSYAFRVEGHVATGRYPAALRPDRVVTVKGVNSELSGDYLIRRVRHHLTRSIYAQRFVVARNARSTGGGGGLSIPGLS
jgi:phage protein D